MTTAREYLVDLGLAKPGRGKFSKVAHRALEKAVAEGKKFSDYPKTSAPVRASKPAEPKGDTPKAEPKPTGSTGMPDIILPDEYRYPEDEYQAVRFEDGKKIVHSMREICNNCGVSLVMCSCDNPTIYGRLSVRIQKK